MAKFSADEIFEVAQQLERHGERFYRQAAARAAGEARNLFLRLADMENEHEKAFAGIREAFELPAIFDPDGDVALSFVNAKVRWIISIDFRDKAQPACRVAGKTLNRIHVERHR